MEGENTVTTVDRDLEAEGDVVAEHFFFEGPTVADDEDDVASAVADTADTAYPTSDVGEVEAPFLEVPPIDGAGVVVPIAKDNDDDVAEGGAELVDALQQLDVVHAVEGQMEEEVVVRTVKGRKEKAENEWNLNLELLRVYMVGHGGNCDVSRNQNGFKHLGLWVKRVRVINFSFIAYRLANVMLKLFSTCYTCNSNVRRKRSWTRRNQLQ